MERNAAPIIRNFRGRNSDLSARIPEVSTPIAKRRSGNTYLDCTSSPTIALSKYYIAIGITSTARMLMVNADDSYRERFFNENSTTPAAVNRTSPDTSSGICVSSHPRSPIDRGTPRAPMMKTGKRNRLLSNAEYEVLPIGVEPSRPEVSAALCPAPK